MPGACSTYEEEEKCTEGFGGKPKPLRKYRHRVMKNIEMVLYMEVRMLWIEFICLRIGTSGSLLCHSNKPSGSIKCGAFLG
jgi:hypothetical protein